MQEVMNELDEWVDYPASHFNLQRLLNTLVGVCGLVGAGSLSPCKMWRRHCEAVLAS